MDKGGTHSTKMGADSLAENTPNVPQIYLPNLSAQDHQILPHNLGYLCGKAIGFDHIRAQNTTKYHNIPHSIG